VALSYGVHPQTKGAILKGTSYYKKIEEVRPGDFVLSWNEKTGQLGYEPVQQTFIRQADKIYKIKYADGTEVETTWSHPFYVAGQGWVDARDLRAGMKSPTATAIAKHNEQLAMSGGMNLPVQMVSYTRLGTGSTLAEAKVELRADLPGAVEITGIEVQDRKEEVYNFDVATADSYFVGESGMLVHNTRYSVITEQIVGKHTGEFKKTDNYVFIDREELEKGVSLESIAMEELRDEGKSLTKESIEAKMKSIEQLNPGLFDSHNPERKISRGDHVLVKAGALEPDGNDPFSMLNPKSIADWFSELFLNKAGDKLDQITDKQNRAPAVKAQEALYNRLLSRQREIIEDNSPILSKHGLNMAATPGLSLNPIKLADVYPFIGISYNAQGNIVVEGEGDYVTESGIPKRKPLKIVIDKQPTRYLKWDEKYSDPDI